jgi:hypothetical protein
MGRAKPAELLAPPIIRHLTHPDLADCVQVQPGDYYGTGKLPAAEYQGQFLADFTFYDVSDQCELL